MRRSNIDLALYGSGASAFELFFWQSVFDIFRTYAIGVIPVKLVLAKAGNGNPGL
ncbi:MAG: hypothetical protein UY62_C0076G0003 [Parcubacteria group bacterium GW2011_GWF2_50_9]|nr:MAG: hypothetical protein UY62_C0076G0003 [Parcubacteria group bacterium GW2011_GWF2_50_9]